MSVDGPPEIQIILGEDETPSISEFLNKTWITFQELVIDEKGKYPTDWEFIVHMIFSIRVRDVATMLLMALLMTGLRCLLNAFVFQPYAERAKLRPADRHKFPEAVWKFLFYSITWTATVYITVFRYDFFTYPCRLWRHSAVYDKVSYLSAELPDDIYWLYMVNFGYYLHNLYGTAFMDVRRRDTVVLLFHHVLTLFLLEFSFLIKYYRIGALVLMLHDVSDMLLAFTKMNTYLRVRDNKKYKFNDYLSTIAFLSFAVSWAWFRIYWFCVKLLHSSNWCVYIYLKDVGGPKLFILFDLMLLLLELMHIYWFCIIVNLTYKVITGQMKEGVADTREYDVIEEENRRKKTH